MRPCSLAATHSAGRLGGCAAPTCTYRQTQPAMQYSSAAFHPAYPLPNFKAHLSQLRRSSTPYQQHNVALSRWLAPDTPATAALDATNSAPLGTIYQQSILESLLRIQQCPHAARLSRFRSAAYTVQCDDPRPNPPHSLRFQLAGVAAPCRTRRGGGPRRLAGAMPAIAPASPLRHPSIAAASPPLRPHSPLTAAAAPPCAPPGRR